MTLSHTPKIAFIFEEQTKICPDTGRVVAFDAALKQNKGITDERLRAIGVLKDGEPRHP